MFGEVAETYDRQRPSYPSQFIDSILSFAGLDKDAATPVAEVGAGTGKASVALAARGIPLTCLEPSAAMAAVARRNLARFPNARVVPATFEDWRPAPHSYGLVLAAQSWHWVSPPVRSAKAHQVLRPGGTLAAVWNMLVERGGRELEEDLDLAYGELLPGKWRRDEAGRVAANDWVVSEIEASGLFAPEPVTILRERWRATYDTESWLRLLCTQSDHRMLDEDTRAALFARLETAVEAYGGHLEVGYVTVGYLARTRDRPAAEAGP